MVLLNTGHRSSKAIIWDRQLTTVLKIISKYVLSTGMIYPDHTVHNKIKIAVQVGNYHISSPQTLSSDTSYLEDELDQLRNEFENHQKMYEFSKMITKR